MEIDLETFIETENAFQVLGQFRKLGLLTPEEMHEAMGMDREGFLAFMREKAGIGRGN